MITCLSCGEVVPHCHYDWSASEFWAEALHGLHENAIKKPVCIIGVGSEAKIYRYKS